ncbi:MAG: N-acetylglucosamine-6-phosphate deacetylase [Anaerolineae bacterium]
MIIKKGIISFGNQLQEGSIRLKGKVITEIAPAIEEQSGELIIDAAGHYVLPGFIDLHTHGLQDTMPQRGDWLRYAHLQLEQGVTACVPTLFAAPEELIRSMRLALEQTDCFRRTPNLLGFRLEFPYVAKAGAGLASALRPITPETTQALFEAGEGFIRIWDVSPELPGAVAFIRWAGDHGIVTSLAHSSATIEEACHAVKAGLRLVTHFYDTFDVPVMTDPGVYPAGLTDYILVEDRLTVEIIPDGVHVHPLLVEKTLRCKGLERVAFITDSVLGAGSPPGIYAGLYEGAQVAVTSDRGVRRIPDDALSGSAMTQLRCFQQAVRRFGLSIPEASALCSRTPAHVLGLNDQGYLDIGMRANIILLDRDFNLEMTILDGAILYRADEHRH